jgi:hypothetical protein
MLLWGFISEIYKKKILSYRSKQVQKINYNEQEKKKVKINTERKNKIFIFFSSQLI